MSVRARTLMGLLTLFYGCVGVAQADAIQCPENLSVVEKFTSPPQGWQLHIEDDPHPLVNVAFYSGHPRERASLVPISKKHSGTTSNARWDFTRGDKLDGVVVEFEPIVNRETLLL
ncbi:MAG: STY0301 family protein [Pseudomonadota bacterium]